MKTKQGNDWKVKIFDTWINTEYLNHLFNVGATFTPKPFTPEFLATVELDHYQIHGAGSDTLRDKNVSGFIFSHKAKGIKIFEHLNEFMQIKNEQDNHKMIIEEFEETIKSNLLKMRLPLPKNSDYTLYYEMMEDEQLTKYKAALAAYNPSLRETCKLISNAATGKPIEKIHTEQFVMLNSEAAFNKLVVKQQENKIADLVVDKVLCGGLIVHYNLNERDRVFAQNPFYISELIYTYTRIKLYNDIFANLPSPDCVAYTDTDAAKLRNFENPKTGINDYEYLVARLKNIPLPYCEEALKYDPRLKDANLLSPNIYGTYEDEIPSKANKANAEQFVTVLYQKKMYITLGINRATKKICVISSTMKGINTSRDVHIPESHIWRHEDHKNDSPEIKPTSEHWIIEYTKTNRQNVESVHHKFNTCDATAQTALSQYMIEQANQKHTMGTVENVNAFIVSAQKYGSAYILTSPFKKHFKSYARSASLTATKDQAFYMNLTGTINRKRLILQKFEDFNI